MTYHAVVFDLWGTLVGWDAHAGEQLYARMGARVGVDAETFYAAWIGEENRRWTGPFADGVRSVCASLGVDDHHVDELVALRVDAVRRMLVPRAGALETLRELRRRGRRLGLISNCSGDLGDAWAGSPLADCFETTVFSFEAGLAKPDARIYRTAAERLGVAPAACLYVDDRPSYVHGAQAAGMDGVLIDPPDGPDPNAAGWEGRRLADPAEVLALV